MKEKMKISFSEYSTFKSCPHKWYLHYFLGFPGDMSEELIFGSALHATIETILGNPLMGRMYKTGRESVSRDVFKASLKQELEKIDDIAFLTKFKKNSLGSIFTFQASKLLDEWDYFSKFRNYEVQDIEFKLDGIKLAENDECEIVYKGFIDLVLKHKTDDSYMIMDWKTSKVPWNIKKKMADNPDLFAQLCLYKHFYSQEKNVDFDKIETKYYNFPRDKPEEQSAFSYVLTREFVDDFLKGFINTCYEIFAKKKNPTDFTKIKMVTKKNFCFRCKYNNEEQCSDTELTQIITV